MAIRKIAIYGRMIEDHLIEKISFLLDDLLKNKFELSVYQPFHDFLSARIPSAQSLKTFDRETWGNTRPDLVFCIGGDGTFLDATTFVQDSDVPMLGLNTGRLGFLSGVSTRELEKIAPALLHEDFELYKRATLRLESNNPLFNGNNFALNELTVHKKDSASMIKIHTFVDDELLNSYWADGLIIATPTGSTAYSLSCGGPIIFPGSKNFVITPVSPHNLSVRPIVISDHKTIRLKIEGRSQFFLVTLDSRSETIDSSTELTITKNNFFIRLLRLKNHSYLSTIRNKLNWGLDQRNE